MGNLTPVPEKWICKASVQCNCCIYAVILQIKGSAWRGVVQGVSGTPFVQLCLIGADDCGYGRCSTFCLASH